MRARWAGCRAPFYRGSLGASPLEVGPARASGPHPTSKPKARHGLSPSGDAVDLTVRHRSLVSRARAARLPSRGGESKRPSGRASLLWAPKGTGRARKRGPWLLRNGGRCALSGKQLPIRPPSRWDLHPRGIVEVETGYRPRSFALSAAQPPAKAVWENNGRPARVTRDGLQNSPARCSSGGWDLRR